MSASVERQLDGTRASLAAADWAAREALTRKVPLQLVNVVDTGPYPYSGIFIEDLIDREWSRKITGEVVENLGNRFRS